MICVSLERGCGNDGIFILPIVSWYMLGPWSVELL